MITIVDYGMGNLGSIFNMFKKLKIESKITSDLQEIGEAEKILLPGVGAFDTAMKKIDEDGFREVLNKKALEDRIPVLGICLGMQLLTNGSEEGKLPGLGWIDADTRRFTFDKGSGLKVPHMGWNEVTLSNESPLTEGLFDLTLTDENPRFYFVHSYYVSVRDQKNSILKTHFGHDFDAAIRNENIYGAQFHPEKSHKFGMQLFKNFANL